MAVQQPTQPVNLMAYDERRQELARKFKELKHGSQSAASFDCRVAQSVVSSILRGRYIDERILGRLEEWAAENYDEYRNRKRVSIPGMATLSSFA